MKRSTIATVLAAALFVLPMGGEAANAESGSPGQPATPQPGMGGPQGMMPMMNMMPMMMHMMEMMQMTGPGMAAMTDHVEGRIAFLRTELKITEAQTSAWNAVAEALRANAKKLSEMHTSMMRPPAAGQQQAPTIGERLDLQERWLAARLEGIRLIKSAVTSLDSTLSDDQKKTADELLLPQMGMGMMGMMMSGQMPRGPMPPGQMQPGRMMQPGGR